MSARRIRLAAAGPPQAALLAALQARCFAAAGPAERWDEAAWGSLLRLSGHFALLALLALRPPDARPEPVGFVLARLAAEEAEILSLGTLPGHRRRGVAASLLAAAADRAAAAGGRVLHLEVAEGNRPALGLYAAAGFATVGRREGYYRRPDGRAEAALLMRRPLA